jgi:adenylate cyclase
MSPKNIPSVGQIATKLSAADTDLSDGPPSLPPLPPGAGEDSDNHENERHSKTMWHQAADLKALGISPQNNGPPDAGSSSTPMGPPSALMPEPEDQIKMESTQSKTVLLPCELENMSAGEETNPAAHLGTPPKAQSKDQKNAEFEEIQHSGKDQEFEEVDPHKAENAKIQKKLDPNSPVYRALKFLLNLVSRNFEHVFVVTSAILITLVYYFVNQKLAFLDLFYLPVIFSGYYAGARFSVVGALMIILFVFLVAILAPELFNMVYDQDNIYLHLTIWGGFLILAGAVVGRQRENLRFQIEKVRGLNIDLENNQKQLERANQDMRQYSEGLEQKVRERTVQLENSLTSIQDLKKKVEETLLNTMDASVVQLIISGRLRSEKREISLLFSDLENFTHYSEERSPELVVRDLNNFMTHMEPIINTYHGHLDKMLGDGLMVEFGVPVLYTCYRLMAVVAGIQMQKAMLKNNFPWKMRVGVATGPAIVGMFGSRRQSYTAIGDVVNLASRLEGLAGAGKVYIDEETYQGWSHVIDAHPIKKLDRSENAEEEKLYQSLETYKKKFNQVTATKDKALIVFQIGHVYMNLKQYDEAADCFKKSVGLAPDVLEHKLAFAEATIKVEEEKRINVKGRRKSVIAYEVIGLKNPLLDASKLPRKIYEEFKEFEGKCLFHEDQMLPAEVLDGSIGHSKMVSILSYAVATRLNLYERERIDILNAAYIADIGKQIIPEQLLNRKGSFNDVEFEEVKKHPLESVRIAQVLGHSNPNMLKIIECSHERADGSGYPYGLKGNLIPIGARIINVVDNYVALISERPYRSAWAPQVVIDELLKNAKLQRFDEVVVSTLIKLLNS